jgi:beta-lactamase class A
MKKAVAILLITSSFCFGADRTQSRDGQAQTKTSLHKEDILWSKLAQNIEALDARLDGVLGVAILDLTTKREWTFHGDEVFPTASTIKLAVLAELFHQEELALQGKPGNARLNDRYTLRKEDLVADSSVLGNMTPDVTALTNRDLGGAIVAVSDNSASNILTTRLGMPRINELLSGLDLKKTRMQRQMMDLEAARQGRENIATPSELVRLLQAIYENKLFRPELTKDFFAMLSTHKESEIPVLLPEELKIANKPGELAGVRCDAGIVFVPNRPFAIAVMTTYDRDEHAAKALISQVALLSWRMFDVLSVSSEYGRQITERNSH